MRANRGASHDLFAAPRRPGRFARVTWPLVAALLLGPPLSLALGPRLLRDRVPLFEASIRWQGAAPAADEWAHPRRPGESVSLRAGEAGEILVARAPGAGAAEALARELAFSRLGASP